MVTYNFILLQLKDVWMARQFSFFVKSEVNELINN